MGYDNDDVISVKYVAGNVSISVITSSLSNPYSLVLGNDKNYLFVAGEYVIYKVSISSGIYSSYAGQAGVKGYVDGSISVKSSTATLYDTEMILSIDSSG